jgi:CHAT domain-containing protein
MARKWFIFLTAVECFLGKQRVKRKFASAIALFVLSCFMCVFLLPGSILVARSLPLSLPSPTNRIDYLSQNLSQNSSNLIDQGRQIYRSTQYAEAIKIWQQALKSSQEPLTKAMLWSNLSLAYQKLGQWQDAKAAIASSFKILETLTDQSPSVLKVKAQALNTRGSLEFAIADIENSLNTWQTATSTYAKAGDLDGEVKGLLNQVQALKSLGFYRRALKTLEQANQILKMQPDSMTKASGLRSLGDVLQLVGNLDRSEEILLQSLAIARQDKSTDTRSDTRSDMRSDMHSEILLSLGNLARLQQNIKGALDFYQQASTVAIGHKAKMQARLNLVGLLAETNDVATAQPIFPQIQTPLLLLTPSRDTVYANINFANSLMQFQQQATSSTPNGLPSRTEIAKILAAAVEQAKSLNDQRAISYALGTLGKLYEQNKQFPIAQDLSQQALLTAQSIDASDIAYLWQWQLGRLLKAQGNNEAAIATYIEAVNTLQALRGDLIAINSGLQFSFRESVEPVYRQLVTLLLSDSQNQSAPRRQERLKQAQTTLESLQLAELVNFFRADCLTPNPVDIAKVDRSAAVLYPIILENSLEVILSLPQQPLQHYSTPISRLQVEDKIGDLRLELRDPSSKDYLVNVKKLYDWLIRPAASQIAQSEVKTLVFVLDGELRDIPMAALHDGQRFLAESYNISLTPGLQLLDPKPLAKDPIAAITAGLSKVGPSFGPLKLTPLPNVERELQQIQAQVPSTILLNQAFTTSNLEKEIDISSFPIVHLATHGKFSSRLEETFLVTWDGQIDIEQLNQLLQDRTRRTDKTLELLILSACETARGDKRAALGLAGMAVRAGARSTIASLWSVDDEATASFMSALYKNLADKNTNKAEALRQAQIALLGDRQLNHPYFWAPFVLLGNWL